MRYSKILFYCAAVAIFILAVLPDYRGLPELFAFSDLMNHLLSFLVLSYLMDSAYPGKKRVSKALALCLYGLLIEIVQYFLPFRRFSVLDLAADAGAVAFYYLFLSQVFHARSERKRDYEKT